MTDDNDGNRALNIAIINFIERSDLRQTIVMIGFIVFMAIILMAMLSMTGAISVFDTP